MSMVSFPALASVTTRLMVAEVLASNALTWSQGYFVRNPLSLSRNSAALLPATTKAPSFLAFSIILARMSSMAARPADPANDRDASRLVTINGFFIASSFGSFPRYDFPRYEFRPSMASHLPAQQHLALLRGGL